MAVIKAKKMGSVKQAKAEAKKAGNYATQRVNADGIKVRFLTEPEEWVQFEEHFMEEPKGFLTCSDDCIGCEEKVRASSRFVVRALNRDTNEVIALIIPKSLASSLLKKYDRYNTILDRDYELTVEGQGLNTEYDLEADEPRAIKLSRYDDVSPTAEELIDALEKDMEAYLQRADSDEPEPSRSRSSNRVSASRSKRGGYDDDDDFDDEDDDDDVPWEEPKKRKSSKVSPRRKSVDEDDDDDMPAPTAKRRPVKRRK